MLKHERFRRILDQLQRHGQVQLGELSTALDVSEDTIRRDIDELARQGALTRIRGGALLPSPIPNAYQAREQHDAVAKQDIARKALALVAEGQLVILDGGTTAGWLARQLPAMGKLTVATHSLPAALALLDHPAIEVRMAGGRVHAQYRVNLGTETVDFYRQLLADVCFIGTYGLHPSAGLTVADAEEAAVKRAIVNASKHVVALVTPEKLGTAASYVVCEAGRIGTLVTAGSVPDAELAPYRDLGIRVL
ncbi:DeoR/GlpR family DNA-binding transcription regulator [Pseudoduganella sp. SL102]|uniref:DeoR/GlpR family DNA-binding transcription regulator n=1 Tax=Pseudoduganella sp. SL102 TaxID=2995154 RepID=UPI00248CC2A1|nr:DeoR/GlpR family DNA-binding transcription regulator [Pseudoduganella sp. SL102]WBS03076.1 DeoR/GlpR family DNA-binding transcription regulator [Pseudoduganella sp. SL102]